MNKTFLSFRASIRTVLIAVLVILGGWGIIASLERIDDSLQDYRQSQNLSEWSRIAARLLTATQHLAYERGRTAVVLRGIEPISASDRTFLDERRSLADSSLAAALVSLQEIPEIEHSEVIKLWQTVKQLRMAVDHNVMLPRDSRDPDLATRWFDTASALIRSIQLTTQGLVGYFRPGEVTTRLTIMAAAALELRITAGVEASIIAQALSAVEEPTEARLLYIHELRGRENMLWDEIDRLVGYVGIESLKDKVKEVKKHHLTVFRPMQDQILTNLTSGGRRVPVPVWELTSASLPTLDGISNLMTMTTENSLRIADERMVHDRNVLVRHIVWSASLLALLILTIRYVVRHVVKPLEQVDRELHRLGALIPSNGKRNEIDRLVASTEALERSLTARAEAERREELHLREIAERKGAEAASEEAKKYLEKIINSIADPIFVKDRQHRWVLLNDALCHFLGYSRDRLVGKSDYDIFPKEEADFFWARDEVVFDTGEENVSEETFTDARGVVHTISTKKTLYRDEKGQEYIVGITRDITERKRTEEALRQSQEKYRLIVDTSNEGIWVLDADHRPSFVNAQMAEMLQYKAEELIGQEIETFMFEEDLPDHAQRMENRRRGIAEHYERRLRRKDGQAVWTIVSATPVIDAGNNFRGSIAMILDITVRKKLEEQLLQSQKMEAIGTLAGGIAHDFNNLLTAIIGYGSLLRLGLDEDSTSRSYIDDILGASEMAAHLTQSLLAFSRKQVISLQPVNLNEIVKRIDKLLKRLIGEDVELKTSLAEGELTILADSGQMEQVLMNLATNSRDAMPDGGTLIIKTERADVSGGIPGSIIPPGAYAVISVSDSGKGMDEVTKQHLFEPFFTTKEMGKGTGLGLSIVYGIVKQHNGEINVYSEPGKGTTFKIYLKLIEAKTEGARAAQLPPLVGGKETILVAEDEAIVRKFMKNILEEYGYTVIEAIDGKDAVARFIENKDRIQLLLFDVVMPKKNGKEAYEEIKKIRENIRVIFSSGYTADIIHNKGILEEGITLITKPVVPDTLLSTIREVLDNPNKSQPADSLD